MYSVKAINLLSVLYILTVHLSDEHVVPGINIYSSSGYGDSRLDWNLVATWLSDTNDSNSDLDCGSKLRSELWCAPGLLPEVIQCARP